MTIFPLPPKALASALVLLVSAGAQGQGASLEALLQAGLEKNRDLLVGRQEVATAAVDTLSVNTATNPHLEIEAMHNLSEPESPTAAVRLSREIQPGIRGRMKRAAQADLEARKGQLRQAEQELLQGIRSAFYDWQILHRKAALQQEVMKRWEGLAKLTSSQMAQGRLSELDLAEARLNALRARQAELALQAERAALERRLELLTGIAEPPAPMADSWMDSLPSLPSLDSLRVRARRANPGLEARRKETRSARLRIELEERKASPPFNVFVGYDREGEGDNMVGGGIEIPLAVFNRNQGGILKARSALREGELREAAANAALESEIKERYGRLQSLAERYGHYRKEIRDLIRKQMNLSEKGFQQGMLGVFDLSRIQAEFLAQEGDGLDLLEAYYREWNTLETSVGGRL